MARDLTSADKTSAIRIRLLPRNLSCRVIAGEVLVDVAAAESDGIDSILLKCRGKSKASVRTVEISYGGLKNIHSSAYLQVYEDNRTLYKDDVEVWNKASQPPPAYSGGTISIPFEFDLPEKTLPTIERIKGQLVTGEVYYYIKAIAKRHGLLKPHRRVKQPFIILDCEPVGHDLVSNLPNWQGPWQLATQSQKIRQGGIVGHHGAIQAEILIPKVDGLPLYTPVSIQINIITLSRSMPFSAKPPQALFPELPKSPLDIKLTKHVRFFVQARGHADQTLEEVGLIAGFKDWPIRKMKGQDKACGASDIEWKVLDPIWISDSSDGKSSNGQWKQEVQCKTKVVFNGLPSVDCYNFSAQHYLKLEVPTPGLTFKLCAPYKLVSGM